jgi:class 3 adenylate cyclase
VAAARERVTAGDLGAASARLDESLALWRGLALADVELEAGARNEVARLEELRVAAQTERIDCELALGRHERVVPELERLLAEHPLRERVRSQLMLALYRSGRQAEALRVYREGRERLVAELGIEPSVPLQRLHRSILEQDPALESPAGVVHTEREVRASADSPLTIVFADGAGILRIARDFPPGSFEPFLNDFLRLLEHVFAEHGGRHLATFFDNVAAAFGSAESAVRAADAARRAVARFQPSLKLKVAVASTQGGDTWSREPEQRAALLCQTAVAGQILLTGEVRELLEREGAAAASLRDLGDRSLGAGGENVRVFELLG